MKKKNIALFMAMAMITSGATVPMEAVYASDEVQIQSEDVFESENEDAAEESTDVIGDTEDSFAENSESETTDMSETEEVEITGDAEQSGDEEIEISEENSDAEEKFADMFSEGQKMLQLTVQRWLKVEVQMQEMPFIDCMQMELWLSTVQEHL